MRTKLHIIILLVLVLHVQQTVPQTVQCYATFHLTGGTCDNLLGQVSLDDCCMNPLYGYKEDSVCKSCRVASWTTWSPWSACSVTCTEGVSQRQRACYGIGRCEDPDLVGNIQTKPCKDFSCCPENGAWAEWGAWQPCAVTCERGLRKRKRTCSNPAPKCGGVCQGNSEEVEDCDTATVCPTHGGWSAWSNWGTCEGECEREGFVPPKQERHRTCTNPPPSHIPPGNDCPGSSIDTQHCIGLPYCPENGNWGAWTAASDCSVTCGVGQRTQHRKCDDPPPKYGGHDCFGENTKKIVCIIPKHCPVDGQWNNWSEWSRCMAPNLRLISCRNRMGMRRRVRDCLGRAYDGAFCVENSLLLENCYDIQGCKAGPSLQIPRALWSEWSEWSYCKPDCGENSVQTRKRVCIPDLSNYSDQRMEIFSGNPDITCPASEKTEENRQCLNLPPC